jgi:hypothetical protein
MSRLIDGLAKKAEVANAKREAVEAAKTRHNFDDDSLCPECGNKMKPTTVAGPLPAKVCFECRICLPSAE